MSKKIKITATAFLVLSVAAFIVIFFVPITYSADKVCDKLWRDTLPRVALSVAIYSLAVICDMRGFFKVHIKDAPRLILWCVPAMLVVIANFPFSALILGTANIERADLIWLFLLKCLFIAISEEVIFRGVLLWLVRDMYKNRRHSFLITVLLSSAIFALFHLLNLAEGAGIGPTLLQVGYTFLTGLMFACTAERTESLWAPIALHFVFDVGGLMITDLGSGTFQDTIFWVLTAVCAAICAVHLILYAISRDRADRQNYEKMAAEKQTSDKE